MRRRISDFFAPRRVKILAGAGALFCLASATPLRSGPAFAQQTGKAGDKATAAQPSPVVAGFKERAKEYVKLREGIEGKMPKLSDESKPAEIERHQESFANLVRSARAGAKPGDLFTPDIARYIRQAIKAEFKGKRRQELREHASEVKGVPLRINHPYPETKELVDTPPTLLLKLPELPKQLRYHFIGRNLLLIDRENRLIIDYLPDALP